MLTNICYHITKWYLKIIMQILKSYCSEETPTTPWYIIHWHLIVDSCKNLLSQVSNDFMWPHVSTVGYLSESHKDVTHNSSFFRFCDYKSLFLRSIPSGSYCIEYLDFQAEILLFSVMNFDFFLLKNEF